MPSSSVFADIPPVRIVTDVTLRSFGEEIFPAGRPVLFKGLVKMWPAVARAETGIDAMSAYLKGMDNGQLTAVLEANNKTSGRFAYATDMNEFNFIRRNKTISDGIDAILAARHQEHAPYIYVQSALIHQFLPAFLADNPCPLLPPSIQPRIWISNATRAQIHNDTADNLACVAAGHRRFTLFPPEQLANLYIGPMEHTPSGRAISLASLEEPDYERFPRLAEALKHAQIAEMEPGDALYVPKYWWHHVQSLDPFNVLINYWWGHQVRGSENPLGAFMAALLSVKDPNPNEKTYWKAMFDHYIFQTGGDPVAHIPEGHQGGLGPLNPHLRAEILRNLQSLLSGRA
ncbi:cupin-like domain-containing protein [Asticcacaulis sp. EMRT-3]|uniref:cupin-like domain-containing protein n=1 Tax=Asticcacaulis sp. EMRT-3 TaxID=3040349 RepID=UPI0024AF6384|nr:cupin-like domain-containing protein [Asticcacaulis sp. EMRT-3]MDI7776080.1 cupin-like domain-containing protein [Asticcacaulis sp. EMRT-3]